MAAAYKVAANVALLLAFAALVGAASEVNAEKETVTWLVTDHLDNPILARDANQNTVWEEDYSPWGERLIQNSANPAGLSFTGHYEEKNLGLIYAGARWYDPEIGRFLSPDPVGFLGGGINHFNRYAYANNSPFVFVDPDGRMAIIKDNVVTPTCTEGGCQSPWMSSWHGVGGARGAGTTVRVGQKTGESAGSAKGATVHKNSRAYNGETHVYTVRNPDGTVNKIGESAQGVRVRDGASKRAEQQVRRLNREAGPGHVSEIRKVFPNKDAARTYETKLIERYRRIYGQDKLPGNRTNR